MRADQLQRMKDLGERLVDQFLVEADPIEWPGAGIAPVDMSKDDRGNQYWCKKNAAATLAIIGRMQTCIEFESTGRNQVAEGADEGDIEEQQKDREKEAQKLMREVIARVGAPT